MSVLLGKIEKLMRPFGVSGHPPPLVSVHVLPPSVDFQSPEPGPPEVRKYGPRTRCQLDAQRTLGFFGSSPTSMNPALSLTNFTSFHVVPGLVVFQIPPPAAATKNVFDGLGMPTISATRPSKLAGPTVRQRKPARVRESRFCASAAI